ncbi:hypothetical protein AJ87_32630 [Rhizobium yanglingense]|nr:hypothetical protein AJ87_32630 [Rhizobium yanglingense]
MGFRQFVEEARGDGRLPEAVDAAVGDEPDVAAALGAGDADIGEAALLLKPGAAAFVERALMREEAFFPAWQENSVEFNPLAECSVMIETASRSSFCSASMTSATCSRKPRNDSKLSIERMSSLRFSSRPGASAVLSAFHMSV